MGAVRYVMNPLAVKLVGLVEVAEAPLFSAYAWLGNEFGRPLAMDAFLALLDGLLETNVLRLWRVDPHSGERTGLPRTPSDLGSRYTEMDHADERYDPFGLSLTIGPAAEPTAEPDWEIDFDFQEGTFELQVHAAAVDAGRALGDVAWLFPDVELTPRQEFRRDKTLHIAGKASSRRTP